MTTPATEAVVAYVNRVLALANVWDDTRDRILAEAASEPDVQFLAETLTVGGHHRADDALRAVLALGLAALASEGGAIGIVHLPEDTIDAWSVTIEWGQEASDGPGAAALVSGAGETLEAALQAVISNYQGSAPR